MTKRMIIMLLCVVLLVAALAGGFFLHIKKMMASIPKPGPQTVSAMKAQQLDWQPQLEAVGSMVPVRGVEVTTEISGLVRSVNFKSGQEVKAGQLLVQLNADSDLALLQSAQAAAEQAALVLARDKRQLEARVVSQAQVDADTADLKVKRANVAQQAATVAKKSIRAPFSGRLGITNVNPGQFLNTGDKIVTLQTLDPIHVDFSLPQNQVGALATGQPVHLRSDAFPGQDFKGQITAISPLVDAATRNLSVRATLPNPKHQLMPGMYAKVAVDTGATQRYLTLPQTAITYNPYGSTVFVVKDDKGGQVAQQVFVTTGATRGDQVAVLSGISEGQMIVTSGQLKLKNGTPVKVDNSIQPANDPNPTPQEK
ncbi:MAG: efflux RND transporter periplasmic adaptor subunit [Burkholderiales bacterium]|nr:efflux RND transporter periplasmic adaptor subunit [Burkholderiales bacterium]MDE2452526.1 efflux RND transporter periplasmic adaptor subunit [Burkholderiales bacterium]